MERRYKVMTCVNNRKTYVQTFCDGTPVTPIVEWKNGEGDAMLATCLKANEKEPDVAELFYTILYGSGPFENINDMKNEMISAIDVNKDTDLWQD